MKVENKRRNSVETVSFTLKDISYFLTQNQEKNISSINLKDERLKSAPQVLLHMRSEPVKVVPVEQNLPKPIDKYKLMQVSSNYNHKFRGNSGAVNIEIPFYLNKIKFVITLGKLAAILQNPLVKEVSVNSYIEEIQKKYNIVGETTKKLSSSILKNWFSPADKDKQIKEASSIIWKKSKEFQTPIVRNNESDHAMQHAPEEFFIRLIENYSAFINAIEAGSELKDRFKIFFFKNSQEAGGETYELYFIFTHYSEVRGETIKENFLLCDYSLKANSASIKNKKTGLPPATPRTTTQTFYNITKLISDKGLAYEDTEHWKKTIDYFNKNSSSSFNFLFREIFNSTSGGWSFTVTSYNENTYNQEILCFIGDSSATKQINFVDTQPSTADCLTKKQEEKHEEIPLGYIPEKTSFENINLVSNETDSSNVSEFVEPKDFYERWSDQGPVRNTQTRAIVAPKGEGHKDGLFFSAANWGGVTSSSELSNDPTDDDVNSTEEYRNPILQIGKSKTEEGASNRIRNSDDRKPKKSNSNPSKAEEIAQLTPIVYHKPGEIFFSPEDLNKLIYQYQENSKEAINTRQDQSGQQIISNHVKPIHSSSKFINDQDKEPASDSNKENKRNGSWFHRGLLRATSHG